MRTRVLAGLLTVGLLGFTTVASAQTIGGGVKGGVNFATVSGTLDPGTTKGMLTGGIVGGFLTISSNMFAFQPEVLYSQEGVKETQGSSEFKAKIGTVQVPLLLRVAPKMKSSRATPFFLVGPAFGSIRSAKGVDPSGKEDDFKNELKSWDASIVFGGGVIVSHFLVEARYAAGVTDLNKNADPKGANRSNVFSVLVGGSF